MAYLEIEISKKKQNEFILIYFDKDNKKHKIYLEAETKEKKEFWVNKFKDAIEKAESGKSFRSDDPNLIPFKDNLYEAFSSKLFVDD